MTESSVLTSRQYPRLLRRVRAVLIDSILITTIILSWWLMLPLMDGWLRPFVFAYPVLAIVLVDPVMVSIRGASPGHHLMGITIQDAKTGKNIGLLRAVLRGVLRGAFGWLSLVLVLATKKHQALHDLICHTTVLLRHPENLPSHEKFSERNTEPRGYSYPSKIRRILVILAYLIAILFLVSIASTVAFSEECLMYDDCSVADGILSIALNVIFVFGFGGAIVFGWRARLFGCRRKKTFSQSY